MQSNKEQYYYARPENKNVIDIYPYDEKKKYKYDSYCYIRNDVRTFYEIVNKR